MRRLVVVIGPPACGKSTWARSLGLVHLASDDVRAELAGSVEAHEYDAVVARAFDVRVQETIDAGEGLVVENGDNARRGKYLLQARAAGYRVEAAVFENDEEALARALARESPELDELAWRTLADRARAAAAAVRDEPWDAVLEPLSDAARPPAA